MIKGVEDGEGETEAYWEVVLCLAVVSMCLSRL